MSAILPPESSRRDLEVIGLVGLAHGTSHFFHLLLPPLFPWLMKDFGLSYTQAGFLMTVFFVISAIGQALAGFVVDKVGARPVLFFGVATLSISGLVLAFANSYSMLVMTAALAGLGNSIFHPADFRCSTDGFQYPGSDTLFQSMVCRVIWAGLLLRWRWLALRH